jgi:DNA (cytosine-5)-methyltransferase 1
VEAILVSDRPLLLDLFCGAGGAGMGYHRAGFDVVGIDIDPQPHYPFAFRQANALDPALWLDATGGRYPDAIHASPPCQRFSKSVSRKHRERHPDLIEPTRELLVASGVPWVIENVPRAPLRDPITLCGSSFDLEVRRHRRFEMSDPPLFVPQCRHFAYEPKYAPAWNRTELLRFRPISGGWTGASDDLEGDKRGMGIDWDVTRHELSESIPPAYTEWIGRVMLGLDY